jgi:hypothetical protein
MNLLDRYQEALRNIPPPGCGCHTAILGIANLGVLSGLVAETIFQDLRRTIPQGKRHISDREITDAINKSLSDIKRGTFTPRPRPAAAVQDGRAALRRIIDKATIRTEDELLETSPIRLPEEPAGDTVLLLETLYEPDELLWIGDRYQAGIIGNTIKSTGEWKGYFKNGGKAGPFIIINPLTGTPSPTKSGDKITLRGDGNIRSHRYAMAEFDGLSREDQIRFWSAVKLPIVALIDSGNRSFHAWISVQKLAPVITAEQWANEIKGRLYDSLLRPMGIDGACSNSARLSRLPGHYREEKGAYQRLLWLSPEGQSIC